MPGEPSGRAGIAAAPLHCARLREPDDIDRLPSPSPSPVLSRAAARARGPGVRGHRCGSDVDPGARDGDRAGLHRFDRRRRPDRRDLSRPARRRRPARAAERGGARRAHRPPARLEGRARRDRRRRPRRRWSTATTRSCCAPSSTASSTSSLVRESDRKDYAGPALRLVDALFTQFLHLPIAGRDGARRERRRSRLGRHRRAPRAGPGVHRRRPAAGDAAGATVRQRRQPAHRRRARLPRRRAQRRGERAARRATRGAGALRRRARPHPGGDGRDARLHRRPRRRLARQPRHRQGAPTSRCCATSSCCRSTSADIERMARDELAHGWAEEAWLRSLSAQRKIPFGAASGGGMAPARPGAGRLLPRAHRRAAARSSASTTSSPCRRGSARWTIVETPAFLQPVSPGASMDPPRLFAPSTTGYYFITPPDSLAEAAARLDMNEDFDRDRIWSTAAHEAMPGHFLQLSIARRHPSFVRRIKSDRVVRRRLGVLRRGDVRPPGALRRRPRRAPVHGALGARARRARDRRPQARFGRMDGGAGGRLLRRAVGLHAQRRRGGGRRASRSARAT